LLARRLLGSTLAASLAAGLLTFDFLHFVMSRTAMLDVFVVFFGLVSFLCLLYDRDRSVTIRPVSRNLFLHRLPCGPGCWRRNRGRSGNRLQVVADIYWQRLCCSHSCKGKAPGTMQPIAIEVLCAKRRASLLVALCSCRQSPTSSYTEDAGYASRGHGWMVWVRAFFARHHRHG
jgi:hypothetical protein